MRFYLNLAGVLHFDSNIENIKKTMIEICLYPDLNSGRADIEKFRRTARKTII